MEGILQSQAFYGPAPAPARCSGIKKTKKQKRPGAAAPDGFLNHRFLPMLSRQHQELKHNRKIEKEFFASLSHLSAFYGLDSIDIKGLLFPENISAAYKYASACLKEIRPELQLAIIQDETHSACLATINEFNTGMYLYYIPVKPLLILLDSAKERETGELLLSVFAWLKQAVHIPYYTDSSSYLFYCYEMIETWLTDDPAYWDEGDYTDNRSQLNASRYFGDIVERKISSPYNLFHFEERVAGFKPADQEQARLFSIAQQALELYRQFPNRSLWDSFRERLIEPEEEHRLNPDQYLSFIWDFHSTLTESLTSYVNSDIQEMGIADSPLAIQLFDKAQAAECLDLGFETKLFHLIDELIGYLNELK